jgi:hypothetical protein
MSNVAINIAAEFTGKKAFKQAESASTSLERSVKNLGKALGITFAGRQIINFGKSAAKAFLEDDKAASQLATTMKNLGLEFSAPSMQKFIENLSQASGVIDDQLRPAMQALLQVTGSVINSQKILSQAIDVSRGTGIDLLTVSQDLAQAYVGNLRGLRKYNLGLTQAELKASSFADIQARINKLFGGASSAYLQTYSGQMDRLTVAANEAKEAIGKGLIEALAGLNGGGAGGLEKTISMLNTLSNGIGKFISRFGTGLGGIGKLLTGDFAGFKAVGEQMLNGTAFKGAIPSISSMVQTDQQKKAEAAAVKRAQALTKATAATTKAKKEQLALTKAAANFDITKINLAAALKGKVSEDEKNRLLALQAIENGNGEEALKYIAKIDAAREDAAAKELARQKLSYEDAMAKIKALNAMIESRQSYLLTVGMPTTTPTTASSGGVAGYSAGGGAAYELPTNPYGSSYYGATGRDPMPITVVLDSNVVGNAVRDVFIGNSLSGSQAAIDRNVGTFSA